MQVSLTPSDLGLAGDPEEDSPELEAELLKAVREHRAPFGASDLCAVADQAIAGHLA